MKIQYLLLALAGCEAFIPSVLNRRMTTGVAFRSQTALAGHNVVIETLDGKQHEIVVESYQSVLEAALDKGIELPHDCKLGTCLACAAKLVSGTVDQTGSTLDDSVMEQGYALTCCSYPQSDLVIKSIPEDQLIDEQFARA